MITILKHFGRLSQHDAEYFWLLVYGEPEDGARIVDEVITPIQVQLPLSS